MSHLGAIVYFVHRDPVVHDLVEGTLGDEFVVVGLRSAEQAMRRAQRQPPAVVVLDCEQGDASPERLVLELRVLVPHLRAVFLADPRDTTRSFRLSDLGTVLPKRQDLERLRHALRTALRLQGMAEGVERLRQDTGVEGRARSTTGSRRDSRIPRPNDEPAAPSSGRRGGGPAGEGP